MLSDEVCPRSPLASAVIVKNTFIDMEDEEAENDPRRSSSEPPSCRHRDTKGGSPSFRARRSKSGFDAASSTSSGSPRETSGSDFASEERSHQGSAELASPSAGLNPNAPVWSPSCVPAAAPPPAMPGSSIAAPPPPGPSAIFYQMLPGSPSQSPVVQSPVLQSHQVLPSQAFGDQRLMAPPPPPPPPLVGPQMPHLAKPYPPTSSQHRLNANAKAWQPGGPLGVPAPAGGNHAMQPSTPPPPPAPAADLLTMVPDSYRKQFEALIDSTKQALGSDKSVVGVDLFENSTLYGRGFTILAWQRADAGARAHEQALKLAKDAIGNSSVRSESVYVLGYKSREPFTPTEFGFAGVLAGVFDESKACTQILGQGFCRRGEDYCKWQHPVCQLPIQVEVRRSRD